MAGFNALPWAPASLLPLLQDEFRTYKIPDLNKHDVTPAFIGRLLWSKTRTPSDYGPLPVAARQFLRGTSGQGRVECATHPTVMHIDAAYLYDMRLAYASSLSNLPCGMPTRERFSPRPFDMARDGDRYTLGRYRITFTIPCQWSHVGIFMVPRPDGRTWHYPDAPGASHTTWAANCECALAVNQGWDVQVSERVIFPNPTRLRRPLDEWRVKLLRIHDAGDAEIQAAIRKIILYTIGGFHPRARTQSETVDAPPREIPPGAKVNMNADGTWTVKSPAPARPSYAVFDHPEWAIEVWARTRTKLLWYSRRVDGVNQPPTGALTVPRETVLGFVTDGLYLSAPTGWPDDGKPGTFRLKRERHFDPPRVAPHANHPRELTALFPDEVVPEPEAE